MRLSGNLAKENEDKMELTVALIAVLSVISNVLIMKHCKKVQLHSDSVEPVVLESSECNCHLQLSEEIRDTVLLVLEEQKLKSMPKQDESHKAWRNQKEEPIKAPPSPHGPPPKPEPLARPYGFPL
jgi:hypothetical protein